MSKFITVPCVGSKAHVALWSQDGDTVFNVVSVHDSVEDVPDFDDLDIFEFTVQNTFETGLPTNGGNLPVADADGRPLWVGCRIEFRVQTYSFNFSSGQGIFKNVDMYGNTRFDSDKPVGVYDRQGFCQSMSREQYRSVCTFQPTGEFKGFRILSTHIGDRHEHGQMNCFIRCVDDPRNVCELIPRPAIRMRA